MSERLGTVDRCVRDLPRSAMYMNERVIEEGKNERTREMTEESTRPPPTTSSTSRSDSTRLTTVLPINDDSRQELSTSNHIYKNYMQHHN